MKNILTFILLLNLVTSCSNGYEPAKSFLKGHNVYVVSETGAEKQLTFNGTDSDPILLKDEGIVIFVRAESNGPTTRKKLMHVNVHDLKEAMLTDQKPYEDGNNGSHDIFNIHSPTLSTDSKDILFITEKYVTGDQLVRVNIETGEWTELFTAQSFEQLDKDPYKGYFLVGQSDIEDRGRDIYYRLVTDKGEIIKKFRDEESMKEFKTGLK
jgi:hypothetical protein